MGADQFLLTWNNHRSNFAETFSQLRVQDQLVDVTLLCDGGSYPAHRLVLAACSPYFHQLFTKLPTHHPLVYLRDVKQAELEALLEFIYRGEVSVANSELTGLIKIAESLRIKGLGDVSQRDTARCDKRAATFTSRSCSPTHHNRPRKAARISTPVSGEVKETQKEVDFASLLASNFGQKSTNIERMVAPEQSAANSRDGQEDNERSVSPTRGESKLRSYLEGMDNPSLSQSAVQDLSKYGLESKKEVEGVSGQKKIRCHQDTIIEDDLIEKDGHNDIKQEIPHINDLSSPAHLDQDAFLFSNFQKLYEQGDFGNAFLTKYTQLLHTFHQQNQIANQFNQTQNVLVSSASSVQDEEDVGPPSTFPSLIPTTVQEHQVSPSPKDSKVPCLTCHLCGATIKHIANFRRHMKQHLNPRRFPCPWCSAAFGRKDNLKTHTRKHHPHDIECPDQGISIPHGGEEDPGQIYNGLGDNSPPSHSNTPQGTPTNEETEDDSLIIAEDHDDDDNNNEDKDEEDLEDDDDEDVDEIEEDD